MRGRGYNKNYLKNNNLAQQLFPADANQQAAVQITPQPSPAQVTSSSAFPASVQITPQHLQITLEQFNNRY